MKQQTGQPVPIWVLTWVAWVRSADGGVPRRRRGVTYIHSLAVAEA
ncbi:hypothetical protein AB0C10_25950 [Microbispora amethystogenes]